MNEQPIADGEWGSARALSAEGMVRRGRILKLARNAARKRRARKAVARVASIGLAAAFVFTAVVRSTVPGSRVVIKPPIVLPVPIPPRAATVVANLPNSLHTSEIEISWIATERGIADRLAVPSAPPIWTRLSDTELMQDIAATGQPGGLAYVNDRPVLLFPF